MTSSGSVEEVDIQAVIIPAPGYPGTQFRSMKISSTHSIFSTRGIPITLKFGFPLVIYRLHEERLPHIPETDNQYATWINIDPKTGFAPEQWRNSIGDVIVACADGTDLDKATFEAIMNYVSDILDAFSDNLPRAPFYKRDALDKHIAKSKEGYLASF